MNPDLSRVYVISTAEGKWPEREVAGEEEEKTGIMRRHNSPWLFSTRLTKAQNENVKNVCEAVLIFCDYSSDSWSNQHRRASVLPTQIHISLCQKCQFSVKLCKKSRKRAVLFDLQTKFASVMQKLYKNKGCQINQNFFFHRKHVQFRLRQESQVTK